MLSSFPFPFRNLSSPFNTNGNPINASEAVSRNGLSAFSTINSCRNPSPPRTYANVSFVSLEKFHTNFTCSFWAFRLWKYSVAMRISPGVRVIIIVIAMILLSQPTLNKRYPMRIVQQSFCSLLLLLPAILPVESWH